MKRRVLRGVTLVETVTAASLSIIAIFTSIAMFLAGMRGWAIGQGKINAERGVQNAVREISMELRQAMSVTVDANGQGLSYRLPEFDQNGSYVVPATWDGVNRRIEYKDGVIQITGGPKNRVILENVILTDPLSPNGNKSYLLFSAGAGSITRQLTVTLAAQAYSNNKEYVKSRVREIIFLRNTPTLTK